MIQKENISPSQGYEDDEIDLKELFLVIKKRKFLIIFTVLLFTTIAFLFSYYKPNIYLASSTIEVANSKKGGMNGDDIIQAALVGDISNNNLDTEIALLKSRTLILDAIKNVDLSTHIWGINKFYKKVELYKNSPIKVEVKKGKDLLFKLQLKDDNSSFILETTGKINGTEFKYKSSHYFNEHIKNEYFDINISRDMDNELLFNKYSFIVYEQNYFADTIKNSMLNVSPLTKQANVLKISIEDTVPLRAQEFVNEIAKLYIKQNIWERTREASKILEFINSQLKIVRENLNKSAKKLEEFQRKAKTIDISQNIEKVSTMLTENETQESILRMKIAILENISRQVSKSRHLETLTLAGLDINDNNLLSLITKLQEALIKRKELSKNYTKAHPDVQIFKS